MENKKKSGYFEDDKGNKSSMRMYCFLALLWSFVLSSLVISAGSVGYGELVLVGLFVTGAFAPKAVQKFAEAKVVNV